MFLLILYLLNADIELEHIPSPFVAAECFDVNKVDSLLYFVTWRGLDIYNWHPTDPQLISRLATDGGAYSIAVSGNYGYIADHYNGLCIVDISNPSLPELVSECNTEGFAYDVVVEGGHAYVADWDNGFVILDVSDPYAPFVTGHCANIGLAFSVTLVDTLAYVGAFDNPLKIINVADPSNPFVIGQFPNDPWRGVDAVVEDTLAYVNCMFWDQREFFSFAVVNVVDPTNPLFVGGVPYGSTPNMPSTNRGMLKVGRYVYTSCQDYGVYIIDVTDAAAPFVEGRYDETDGFGYGYILEDSLLVVPHYQEGFSIADVCDPQKPIKVYHHQNIDWQHFTFDDDLSYLYLTGWIWDNNKYFHSTLRLVDFGDPINPLISSDLYFTGKSYLYKGSIDYPYLAMTLGRGNPPNETLYTAVVDVSNPHAPGLYRFVERSGVLDLHIPYLYCQHGAQIRIADINDPLFWIDSLRLRTNAYDIEVSDTLVFVTIEDSLIILDVSTGQELGSCFHGRPYAIHMSLDYPLIAVAYTPFPGSTYGVLLFDVSNPFSPSLQFDTLIYAPPLDPSYFFVGCKLLDTLLYLCRGGYGFDIWKIDYPDSIYRIINQDTPGAAEFIDAHDDVILVLDYSDLELYRIISPAIEEAGFTHERTSKLYLDALPNPFTVATEIRCGAFVADGRAVELNIYDVAGRLVRQFFLPLNEVEMSSTVTWDGTDSKGKRLPQGVYFIRVETDGDSYAQKVVLLK